jgi:DNA-binding CsgD family transcriptional regulator
VRRTGRSPGIAQQDTPHLVLYTAELDVVGTSDGFAPFIGDWPDLGPADHGVPAGATAFVRSLLREPRHDGRPRTGLLRPTLALDVFELAPPGPVGVVATFERFRVRDPVREAALRFDLTERERQVLTLLLSGLGTAGAAGRLGLSEMTVRDRIKRLRQKTGARSLSGMIAMLLGWDAEEPLLGFLDAEDAR